MLALFAFSSCDIDNSSAEDYSVVYDTDEKKTITENIDIYAIWKKEKIVVTFYYKEASSSSTDVKTETMEVTSAYNDFIFPDVNKETEEKACTSWAKSDGSYACEANSKKSLYDLSLSEYKLPSVYDESDMSYHASCDFYEYWYNKSSMKTYFFNMNDCSSSKDGYSLGGWNIEAHAKETWPHADELPGEVYDSKNWNPVNIWYARWVDETKFNANKGEISFYSDETKNEEEKITRSAYAYPVEYTVIASYSENCALVLPDCPFTKEGKTFSGWKNGKINSIKQPGESVKFNANGSGFYGNIFVAVWE